MSGTNGTEVIAPAGKKFTAGAMTLDITPLRVGQLPAVLAALRAVDLSGGITLDDIPQLLIAHYPALLEAIAAAVRRSPEELAELELDQFADLVLTVVEVNSDFFVHRLAPKLQAMASGVAAKHGAGRTPSNS